jgi:regulatory protein
MSLLKRTLTGKTGCLLVKIYKMVQGVDKLSALKKAQNICAKQEKCKADIRQKLFEWKLEPKDHSWILEQLEKDKFIDETRYTSFYVRDKFRFNKWGKIKIEFELRGKQISPEIIKEALGEILEMDYINTCETLLHQKLNKLKNEDPGKKKEKLMRFAYSRGFEQDLIIKIVEKLLYL